MVRTNSKTLYNLIFLVAVLCMIAASIGVFYNTGNGPYEVKNQYGDIVKIYGSGIYSHDSYFKAPIFRGTDLVMLFMAIPLLIVITIIDIKKRSLKSTILLSSVLAVFLYYSASIVFGITYNSLHLLYIALFSSSLFSFILVMNMIVYEKIERSVKIESFKGYYIFLVLTGVALSGCLAA